MKFLLVLFSFLSVALAQFSQQEIAENTYIVKVEEDYDGPGQILEFGKVRFAIVRKDDFKKNAKGIIEVYEDGLAHAEDCQQGAPWHLNSISQGTFPIGSTYAFDSPQPDELIYILDTYVDTYHPDFGSRVQRGPAFATGQHYHGTMVTGMALGNTYGVNKNARGMTVQVLDANGIGAWSVILSGLDWIARQIRRGVVNISIGGPKNDAVNQAVNGMVDAGWRVVVAAGNSGDDACNASPSSSNAIIVGAYNSSGYISQFSNYGTCVNVHAPGEAILSAYPGGLSAWASGTSFAAPVVAGILSANNGWGKQELLNAANIVIDVNRPDTTTKGARLGQSSNCFKLIIQPPIKGIFQKSAYEKEKQFADKDGLIYDRFIYGENKLDSWN